MGGLSGSIPQAGKMNDQPTIRQDIQHTHHTSDELQIRLTVCYSYNTLYNIHTSEVEVHGVVEEAAAPDAGQQARYGHERHGDHVREAGDGGEPLAVALPAVDAAPPDVNAHDVLRGPTFQFQGVIHICVVMSSKSVGQKCVGACLLPSETRRVI